MKLHKHLIKRTSFTVEIVGDDMEFNQINEFVATMTSKRMGVNIGESRMPCTLDPALFIPFLREELKTIQKEEDKAGRSFIEDPEIIAVPERHLLMQDGITDKRVRVITFLSVCRIKGKDYMASIRGCLPDDKVLTTAFIGSVFQTFKSVDGYPRISDKLM